MQYFKWMMVGIFILFIRTTYAQDDELFWVTQAGGASTDDAADIAISSTAKMAVTGSFEGTATFGAAMLTSVGLRDIFVVKYDRNGNVLWAKQVGGESDDRGEGVAIDDSRNTIVVGRFSSATVTFDTITLSNAGSDDIFIVKYDLDGNVLWAQRAGGTAADIVTSVATDMQDNGIVITGYFFDTATFGTTSLTSAGEEDIFVAKYDESGNLLWATRAGGTQRDKASDVAIDVGDNVYITGDFEGTATFGTTILTSAGLTDMFVLKYNSSGTFQWARRDGGASSELGVSLNTATEGLFDVIVTGSFFGTAIFNTGTDTVSLPSAGDRDIFIARYSRTGALLGAIRTGGQSTDFVNALAVDDFTNIFLTGSFRDSTQFGATKLKSDGLDDIFITKFNENFDPLWAKRAGGTGLDRANGIAVNLSDEDIGLAGTFENTAFFESKPPLTSRGGVDIFVARYGIVQTNRPRPPSNLRVRTVSSTQIDVTWEDRSDNEAGFTIERRIQGGSFAFLVTVGPNTEKYADTSVLPETTYTYRMFAFNDKGESGRTGGSTTTSLAGPAECKATSKSQHSILIEWRDRSGKEDGYKILRSTQTTDESFVEIHQTVSQVESYEDTTGLLPNTRYHYRVYAFLLDGTIENRSDFCPFSEMTPMLPPPAPTLDSPEDGATNVSANPTLSWNVSTGATSYRLQVAATLSFATAVADQSGITQPSFTVNGLSHGTAYFWRVSATNAGGTSPFSSVRSFTTMTSQTCKDVTVVPSWNLVSVPVLALNMTTGSLFPTAISEAFGFEQNNLLPTTILTSGKGYWLKFAANASVQICGDLIGLNTIPVAAGWNIIGIYARDISVNQINSVPAGIIDSPFYGFNPNTSYEPAVILQSGEGYWIKVKGEGTLNLPVSGIAKRVSSLQVGERVESHWGKIIVTDSTGKTAALYAVNNDINLRRYELPPIPPAGIFDMRYGSGRYVERLAEEGLEINFSSAAYPLRLRVEGMIIRVKDAVDGNFLSETLASGEEIVVSDAQINAIRIEPARTATTPLAYALHQNYPNPFNPTTKMTFSLPVAGKVRLTLYNLLGEKVADLIDEEMKPGFHQVELNAKEYPSGVYLYRLETGTFTSLKKLVILK